MELEAIQETKQHNVLSDEFQDFIKTLGETTSCEGGLMSHYKGFWIPSHKIRGLLSSQRHFQAKDTDIILGSLPKSGTTWLKALVFSIVNRRKYSASQSPLLTSNPHDLVPYIEILCNNAGGERLVDDIPNPRIFSTHIPHQLLPSTILDSQCKIVYICRNPLDSFNSAWHFWDTNTFGKHKPLPMDEAFELFLEGLSSHGPFWDHVLGYWNASLKHPQKVLFLKYEDLKQDTVSSVKKLADFLGFSFSLEEEKNHIIEETTRLCSFENLKNLEVNKTSEAPNMLRAKKSSFFREGKVGDWCNHLSPSIVERFQKLMEKKFAESGLCFEFHDKSKCL